MNKIVQFQSLDTFIQKIKRGNQKVVLVGGCFDILHLGHIKFIHRSKSFGDTLIIALESDVNVQRLKGKNRPFNTQIERAEILSHISEVDFVLMLPPMAEHEEYTSLVTKIHPHVIALTAEDKYAEQKRKQAENIGADFKIIDKFQTYSTSKLAKLLGLD